MTQVAWKPWLARAGVALVGLAWLAALVIVIPYNRWLAGERAPLLASATAIEADGNTECVIACRVITQLMWYTRCDTRLLRDVAALPQLVAPRSYIVSVPHAVVDVAPIAAEQHATATAVPTGNERAHVWRLSR